MGISNMTTPPRRIRADSQTWETQWGGFSRAWYEGTVDEDLEMVVPSVEEGTLIEECWIGMVGVPSEVRRDGVDPFVEG